jgi:glycosyltransferase involved in cell wall biosynthesis
MNLIRANLQYVDAFIAVSDYYAKFMADYLGIPENKIYTVPLGINLEDHHLRQPNHSDVFTVGYFARIAPEKGLHVLAEAYQKMRQRHPSINARLEVAGYLAPEHREYLQDIEQKMKDWKLADEFNYRGVLDRQGKIDFLHTLDVLSVPTPYSDPKGMFLFEAMANGIPVVQPRHGAFPEVIAKTSGGILFEPEDADALADGLLSIWQDKALAEELSQNGFQGVRKYYSAERMAERAVEVYTSLLAAKS